VKGVPNRPSLQGKTEPANAPECPLVRDRDLLQVQYKYRSLGHHAPCGVFRCNGRVDHFLAVNPALVHLLGYGSPDQLAGASLRRKIYCAPGRYTQLLKQMLASIRKDAAVRNEGYRVPGGITSDSAAGETAYA
jgi:PAS domain-containing protein